VFARADSFAESFIATARAANAETTPIRSAAASMYGFALAATLKAF